MAGDNTIIIDTISSEEIELANFHQFPIAQEPKRVNRFIVTFPRVFRIESYLIQKITRPKFRLVNGSYQWDNIEVDLIDVIGPSTAHSLCTMAEFCKKIKETKPDNQPLFSFFINDLDPTGVEIGHWIIDVGELLLIDFGNYDYNDDDGIQTCRVILKPLRCRVR